MHRTRSGFLIAFSQRRLGSRWWLSPALSPTTSAVPSASVTLSREGGDVLPDAVVDAWLRWRRQQGSGGAAYSSVALSRSVADVLSRIPISELGEAHGTITEETDSEVAEDNCKRSPVTSAAASVGALVDSLHLATWGGKHVPCPSTPTEVVFAQLRIFAPLFLQLDAATEHLAVLAAYCDEAMEGNAEKGSTAASLYMQRVLRQVRVSWQPWVTSAQRERLLAGVTSFTASHYGPGSFQKGMETQRRPSSATSTCDGVGSSNGVPNGFFVSLQKTHETDQERSWRILLESVPTFYVSADLVREDVLRRYPSDGARLWHLWTRTASTAAERAAAVAVDGHPVSPSNGAQTDFGDSSTDAPCLEVTADGRAVRVPSKEVCLQFGCPARLIFSTQPGTCAMPRERYSLVQNVRYGPQLMHYASWLLATTVPTAAANLSDIRRVFDVQRCRKEGDEQPEASTAEAVVQQSSDISPPFSVCRTFFPCMEVLLDHPDLAFALQIHDPARDLVCAGLPPPSPRPGVRRHDSTDNSLHVQLHPAFAHELRGAADVVLNVLRQAQRACNAAAVCVTAAASHLVPASVAVHVRSSPTDVVPPSLASFLRCKISAGASDVAAATAEEEEKRHFRGNVVCVSCVDRSAGTPLSTSSAGQELLLAFACVSTRVDVVVITAPCVSALLTRLSAAGQTSQADASSAFSSPEEQTEEAPCGVDALARLLCHDSVAKVVPSRFYGNARRGGLARLFGVLQDSVITLCPLQHVACYAGIPMGELMAKDDEEGDLLLAATVNQRHDVRIEVTPDQITHEVVGEAERDSIMKAVHDAASLAVAALLLCRDRHREQQLHCPRVTPPHAHSLLRGTESHLSLTDLLRRWAGSTRAMHDHSVAVRLSRYTRWLSGLTSTLGGSCWEIDLAQSTRQSGESLSPAAARALLRELIATYGPEPLPPIHWRSTLLSDTDASRCAEVNGLETGTPVLAAAAATPDSSITTEDVLLPAKDIDTPQLTECDEHLSFDATLYDALLRDAAEVTQSAGASPWPPPPPPPPSAADAGVLAVATEIETSSSEKGQQSAAPISVSPPAQATTADTGASASHEQDTLQFYLTTVLGSDAAAAAASVTQRTPATSAPRERVEHSNQPAMVMTAPAAGPTAAPSPPATPIDIADRTKLPLGFLFGPRKSFPSPDKNTAAVAGGRSGFIPMQQQTPLQGASWPSNLPQERPRLQPGRQLCCNERYNAPPTAPLRGLTSSFYLPTVSSAPPMRSSATNVARFDPFAPWSAGAGGNTNEAVSASASADSAFPPPPLPPPPPPMPAATASVASTPTAPSGCATDLTADFLGRVSDAERLRLASLIVDILRGSPSPPSAPPR
ncbi:hypothetical protein ABB37_03426 [Leptomonas pyrrhocoris]|uniref:Uncharacterized protein n=1 Tax=Leptomonas pyrrhocoris TaxID=157538 RepID=A0A0M9G557_LEPPY|nr:hypothetical protein ABB37_03426 [Leptomonas pyrrhocoris]KPA82336.1 hypothetical protein ABB37_03426 [Leptomonas pyrrhocoris]|eukprot:XP_015660775.1 hypothetical protein ABB37_03426 [Leptomonas pyrrhocoris]